MKIIRIIAVIVFVIVFIIAAMWIWICFNPGVIYCYKGGIYMSMEAAPLPVL